MAERRVFVRGARRFEVVVISIAAINRRRARAIRRLATRQLLPSTIAARLGIPAGDVLSVLATPQTKGLFDAWR